MKRPINFKLSTLAKNDLENIFKFTIRNWGEIKAREYAQKLSDGFVLLSQSPKIGKQRNDIYINALSFPIGSHIIFYSINNNIDSKIEIARVLHKHMDIEKHF